MAPDGLDNNRKIIITMRSLHHKVVVITGAGSGIGRALAILLARKACRLALADINEAGLQETKEACEQFPAEVVATLVDLSNREAVYQWAKDTHATFGEVNLVVNNAGVSLTGTAEDLDYVQFEWLMSINFWGVVYGTKAFLPYLKQAKEAHLVNISSVFGIIAFPASSAYNASKFAVRGFTETLREELMIEKSHVKVTCVHPGGIQTNIAYGGRVISNPKWGIHDSQHAGREFAKVAKTTPEQAADAIVRAVILERGRLLIGMDAKILDLLQRFLPVVYQKLLAHIWRKRFKP